LLSAFKLLPPDQMTNGGDFTVCASAAIGVLLEDPATDLPAMRPRLAVVRAERES
jgi:hypothetical protein